MSPQEQDSPNENAEFIAENHWQVKINLLFKKYLYKKHNLKKNVIPVTTMSYLQRRIF